MAKKGRPPTFVRDPEGVEIHGLSAKPYLNKSDIKGYRFYATFFPAVTFGIFPTRDDAEPIARYLRWQAEQEGETVRFTVKRPITTEDHAEVRRFLESDPSAPVEVVDGVPQFPAPPDWWHQKVCDEMEGKPVDWDSIPEDLLIPAKVVWSTVGDFIRSTPQKAAKLIGIPQIAYLTDLEKPRTLNLSLAGTNYHNDKRAGITNKQWKNSKVWWAEFVKYCGDLGVTEVNQLDFDIFQQYANHVKTQQSIKSAKTKRVKANSYRRSRFGTVTTVINYAAETQKIDAAEWARLKLAWKKTLRLPKQKEGQKNILTPGEFQAMLDKASDFDKALLLLGVNTAFSPIDFDVQWTHIDLDSQTLYYRREKKDEGQIEGITRSAVLFDETVEALRKIKTDTQWVFAMREGPIAPSTVWKRIIHIRGAAGITKNIRPEDLRNTAATIAAENAPAAQYNVLMGHSLGAEDQGYIARHRYFTYDACRAIADYLGLTISVQKPNGKGKCP